MIYVEGAYNGSSILRMTKAEREKLAERFSEKSQELRNLLIKLWDNKIETVACCRGHEVFDECDYDIDCAIVQPYIAIKYNENTRDYLGKVFSYLKDDGNHIAYVDVLTFEGEVIFRIKGSKVQDVAMFDDLASLLDQKLKKKREYYALELLLKKLGTNNGTSRYVFRKNGNDFEKKVWISNGTNWSTHNFFLNDDSIRKSFLLKSLHNRIINGPFSVKKLVSNIKVSLENFKDKKAKGKVNRKARHTVSKNNKMLIKRHSKMSKDNTN